MSAVLEGGARLLTILLGAIEVTAGIVLAVLVAMIGQAVESPHPIGSVFLIGLSVVSILLPAIAVGLALFSDRRNAVFLSLLVVIAYPTVLISAYVTYA